ncbi:uncharacterized protein PFL1_00862 [Pseudozyma flocculosa PF-1]|uniref:Related to 30S ribosomal protein S16 n=1 Tax=Pseudozyma flocculosa TaxID=84751 RepID=A0A5C3F2D9_9BASI|nr:uncharacterized protein PFL1_00862 [Pseudozyma flocculosa PF-1]EPQ31529.1 hypothetical protein PFL1_00862 [Pseudozyma flocculosa PF-1]SPO38683.1 related to 30S ribosomal protein S16 [Pseudozyma flocculosa]
MVVRLRLARHGTRNNPFYHVVAINDSKPRDARPIEKLGEYDPIPRPVPVHVARAPYTPAPATSLVDPSLISTGSASNKGKTKATEGYGKVMTSGLNVETTLQKRIEWNEDRIKYWLGTGAQPSKPVARLLHRAGLVPPGVWYKGMPPLPDIEANAAAASTKPNKPSSPKSTTARNPTKKAKPADPRDISAILRAVGATEFAKKGSPGASAFKKASTREEILRPHLTGESTMDQAS